MDEIRALWTQPAHRIDMLRDGWKTVGNAFLIARGLVNRLWSK